MKAPPNPVEEDCVYVWAVAANGEALYRQGVSESCPMVRDNRDFIILNYILV